MVELVDVNNYDTDIIKYSMKLYRGNTMIVTMYFHKSSNVPDIESI